MLLATIAFCLYKSYHMRSSTANTLCLCYKCPKLLCITAWLCANVPHHILTYFAKEKTNHLDRNPTRLCIISSRHCHLTMPNDGFQCQTQRRKSIDFFIINLPQIILWTPHHHECRMPPPLHQTKAIVDVKLTLTSSTIGRKRQNSKPRRQGQ